jgi:hypothetical protein
MTNEIKLVRKIKDYLDDVLKTNPLSERISKGNNLLSTATRVRLRKTATAKK